MNKFWFHVTRYNHGDKFTLTPRISRRMMAYERFKSANVKRISVCPTIAQCLLALSNQYNPDQELYVYSYVGQADDKKPITNVNDAKWTKEAWLDRPTLFTLDGKIRLVECGELNWRTEVKEGITDHFPIGIKKEAKFSWIVDV